MLKSISFKKLAVLTAGLAIVLSSCGLQNSASESSDDATAAGKTKNYALTVSGYCWDNYEQWNEVQMAFWNEWIAGSNGADLYWDQQSSTILSNADPAYAQQMTAASLGLMPTNDSNWWAGLTDGVPCPEGAVSAEDADVQASISNAPVCLKPELKQAMIDGWSEQANRPLGGEVTEEYIAKMKRGLEVTKGTCTN
jgi:hypothetical protein